MRNILKYIFPIFFTFNKKNDNVYVFHASTNDDRSDFIFEFAIGKRTGEIEGIEDMLSSLLSWLPNQRRFYCTSKRLLNSQISSENFSEIEADFIKKASSYIWGEIMNFFDIDTPLENMGIGSFEEFDFLQGKNQIETIKNYYELLTTDRYDDKILENALFIHTSLDSYKKSMSWVELVRSGVEDPNEIFQACGNHMLGKHFDIIEEQKRIFIEEQRINIKANRETVIADIQEKTLLVCTKIFFNIEKKDEKYYLDFYYDSARGTCVIDKNNIDSKQFSLVHVIPQKRIFIGWGNDNISYVQELLEIEEIDILFKEILKEIYACYVDFQKPFEKIFIGKKLDNILKIFKISTQKSIPESLLDLDNVIFEDVRKSILTCVDECYNYLIPMTKENCEKKFKNILVAAFGQSFKYFYNVSSII